jgi:hypothetical protein
LKKEPKNFCRLARALDPTRAPMNKSFCFFFQKEALSSLHCQLASFSSRHPCKRVRAELH